jgi:hypothetical protein
VRLASAVPRAALAPETARRTGRLLRQEGCDLARVTPAELAAGCPIYLEGDVDADRARELMARHGVAQAPVLDGDDLVGFAVLEELGPAAAAPRVVARPGGPPGGGPALSASASRGARPR